MKLSLQPNHTIQQIQQEFKNLFSHLKIEFYRKGHQDEEGNLKRDQYLHNTTLGQILGEDKTLELTIDPEITTAEFEQWFASQYELHIQVFRLQRGTWLQTTLTDTLTLAQQNEKGIQADIDIIPESPSDIDTN